MTFTLKRIYAGITLTGISLMAFTAILWIAGARINITKSIAVGLYWTSNKPIQKNDYVIFCPPDNRIFATAKKRHYISGGFCPGGYGYMMKRVLASKGDTIKVTNKGVFVNGIILPHSKPLAADAADQKLPHYRIGPYKLGNSEVLLMTDVSDTSFDSRYFGPINRSQIQSVVTPILTW